ncbi:hypothetical protein IJU97_03225 [bacterium]|nr:hypothetical protein [bacterium]
MIFIDVLEVTSPRLENVLDASELLNVRVLNASQLTYNVRSICSQASSHVFELSAQFTNIHSRVRSVTEIVPSLAEISQSKIVTSSVVFLTTF